MTNKPQNTFFDEVEILESLILDDLEHLRTNPVHYPFRWTFKNVDNSLENVAIINNIMVNEVPSTNVKPKSKKNVRSLLLLSGEEIMKHMKIRSDIKKLPLPKVLKTFLDDEIMPPLV